MKRLFIAIPFEVPAKLESTITELKTILKDDKISWVKQSQIHCTLQFIGDCEDNRVDRVIDAVKSSAAALTSFRVCAMGMGTFGEKSKPRVIWAGWKDNGETEKLFSNLSRILLNAGIAKPENRFHPHLTLARVKDIKDPMILHDFTKERMDMVFSEFKAKEVVLMESILGPGGAVYKTLYRAELPSE